LADKTLISQTLISSYVLNEMLRCVGILVEFSNIWEFVVGYDQA